MGLAKENVKMEGLKKSNIEHKEAFPERIRVQMLNIVVKTQSSALCLDMVQSKVSGALEKIIHDQLSILTMETIV